MKPVTEIPAPNPQLAWWINALRFYADPIDYMGSLRRYGEVVRFVRGENGSLLYSEPRSKQTVFVFGAKYNHQILSDIETFEARPASGPQTAEFLRLMDSVVFVNGMAHKKYRQLMMPAFHKKRIEGYRDDIVRLTEIMLNQWWSPNQQRDLLPDFQRLTLLIANQAFFGIDVSEEADSLGEIIQAWFSLLTSPAAIFRVDIPGTPYHQMKVLSAKVDQEMRKLIARRRAQGLTSHDVLSMLLQAQDEEGNQLSDDEVIGNANTLFIAGHETTANALTWTLLLLAQHPQVMRDLYDELDGALKGSPPDVEQTNQLPLLEAVIKESMRLLSPGTMSIRIASRDVEMGGYTIPQHSEVIFSRYHTHHDPTVYEQSEHFKPERWFSITPSPYEYLPFSTGARMCIGAAFAMFEMKIVLSMLLQRYRVQLIDGTKIGRKVGFTMSPSPGVPALLHAQDCQFERSPARLDGKILDMVQMP
jgi:cytochrome P450